MFNPTPEQAVIIAQVLFLLGLIFQGVRWLIARTGWKPPVLQLRILVVATAVVLTYLFDVIVLTLPPPAPAFTQPYAAAFLAWLEGTIAALGLFYSVAHALYKVFWQRVFDSKLASKIPVVKELASDKLPVSA